MTDEKEPWEVPTPSRSGDDPVELSGKQRIAAQEVFRQMMPTWVEIQRLLLLKTYPGRTR